MKSIQYWEERYKSKGNSGDGSYNKLQEFKSDVINSFIKTNKIKQVIEYGCGDGNQLKQLNIPEYVGVDVSSTIISKCKEMFKDDKTKQFVLHNGTSLNSDYFNTCDLSLSTDVIFHLIEDDIYKTYLENLFNSSNKFVIIYAYDYEPTSNDNFSWHYKPRKFTPYIKETFKDWKLSKTILNKYPVSQYGTKLGSYSNFYIYKKINK